MGPCVAYCLCSRVGCVAVAVPAPTICFAPLSIVTASKQDRDSGGAFVTQRMLEAVASLQIKPSQTASCTTLISACSEQRSITN